MIQQLQQPMRNDSPFKSGMFASSRQLRRRALCIVWPLTCKAEDPVGANTKAEPSPSSDSIV
ncbi:Putative transferase CAF17, mitochondrial [Frankliniella fusca]|uniref:Transferase CAF17, mitochondrial n=1 Tax=Frankliniella fusca TaxID=407009 RepID=A0AAE1HN80_9NEOP|nr:Putative transferase CAF17, mitochondrial [Frankliniella fusca]